MRKNLLFLIGVLFISSSTLAKTSVTELSKNTAFESGDIIRLKDSPFSVTVGWFKGSECAVPGFNCGSGYIPPHFTFQSDCGKLNPCPYVVLYLPRGENSKTLSIENEESCEKMKSESCFYEFARAYKTDSGCSNLKSPYGRYHCLRFFNHSALPENKTLCDQLPETIYALRWNCYYEFAIRYKDPSFCEKYSVADQSGKDRCFLKMAELLKNKSLCEKISVSKDNSYKEQCNALK